MQSPLQMQLQVMNGRVCGGGMHESPLSPTAETLHLIPSGCPLISTEEPVLVHKGTMTYHHIRTMRVRC